MFSQLSSRLTDIFIFLILTIVSIERDTLIAVFPQISDTTFELSWVFLQNLFSFRKLSFHLPPFITMAGLLNFKAQDCPQNIYNNRFKLHHLTGHSNCRDLATFDQFQNNFQIRNLHFIASNFYWFSRFETMFYLFILYFVN